MRLQFTTDQKATSGIQNLHKQNLLSLAQASCIQLNILPFPLFLLPEVGHCQDQGPVRCADLQHARVIPASAGETPGLSYSSHNHPGKMSALAPPDLGQFCVARANFASSSQPNHVCELRCSGRNSPHSITSPCLETTAPAGLCDHHTCVT